MRIEDALEGDYGNPARRQRHMDVLNEEIRIAETRLRALLNVIAEGEP